VSGRKGTRERELQDAIAQSGHRPATRCVFRALLDRADFGTANIPPRFQPRSLDEVARWSGFSRATVKRQLDVLEEFGWVERKRGGHGRGDSTSYCLLEGRPLVKPQAVSGAERIRRWRERKAAQKRVTSGSETRYEEAQKKSQVPGQDTFSDGGHLGGRDGGVTASSRTSGSGSGSEVSVRGNDAAAVSDGASGGVVWPLVHRCRKCHGPVHRDLWEAGEHPDCERYRSPLQREESP
jgi:hypothetical protein